MSIAWVTGARGFIGRRLVLALRDQGLVVCGVGHGHLPAESWPAAGLSNWLDLPISSEALGQLATDHRIPDFVFHLSGGFPPRGFLPSPLPGLPHATHNKTKTP